MNPISNQNRINQRFKEYGVVINKMINVNPYALIRYVTKEVIMVQYGRIRKEQPELTEMETYDKATENQ